MTAKKSEEDILKFVKETYKGKWSISEKLNKVTKKEAKENEKIVRLNLAEVV